MVKSKKKILQNFVAFSECMNFTLISLIAEEAGINVEVHLRNKLEKHVSSGSNGAKSDLDMV